MAHSIMSDTLYVISQHLDFKDFIELLYVNKYFNDMIKQTESYRYHKSLCDKCNFESLTPIMQSIIEYHVMKSLEINTDKIIYYAGLCSKFKIYKLLEIILADPNNKYKIYDNCLDHSRKTSQYEIVNNIIKNATDYYTIEIIKKYYIYCLSYSMTEHCRVHDILIKYIDRSYIDFFSHNILSLCLSYNDVALEIILNHSYKNPYMDYYISKIITRVGDEFWLPENAHFKTLILNYVSSNNSLLQQYQNKMFLYGCQQKTVDFFKTNNLHLNGTFDIVIGITACFRNSNGLSIISWILDDEKIILNAGQIISIYSSIPLDIQLQNYWKGRYKDVIDNYYKNITDDQLKNLMYGSINLLFEYFEANRIINVLCSTSIEGHWRKDLSDNLINYLSDNLDFGGIKEEYYHKILYIFLIRNNTVTLQKFLSYSYAKEKKIKSLVKLMNLITENSNDLKSIYDISSAIIQIIKIENSNIL